MMVIVSIGAISFHAVMASDTWLLHPAVMGQKASFLLRLGPKYRVGPLLSLLSLCRPRGKWWPTRKREQTKVPTRLWHRVGVHQLTITRAQWSSWRRASRTHTGKGLGDRWERNKNLVNLSLTRPGIGRDGESHSIQYLLTVLPDAPLCAQQCHNIPYH